MNENETLFVEFTRVLNRLNELEPETEEYKILVSRIAELVKAQAEIDKLQKSKTDHPLVWRILENGPLVSGLLSLGLGISILMHERTAILVSKAYGLVRFK